MMKESCNCRNDSTSKQQLLDTINQSSFAMYDMLLYLDTHAEDQEAMAYFQKQLCTRKEALKEYAQQFGPLRLDDIDASHSDSWEWMNQRWPWEVSKKGGC